MQGPPEECYTTDVAIHPVSLGMFYWSELVTMESCRQSANAPGSALSNKSFVVVVEEVSEGGRLCVYTKIFRQQSEAKN